MNRKRSLAYAFVLVAAGLCPLALSLPMASAQVVAPSVYTTDIQVQGEAEGTEFNDWATSGITIVDMDPADNPGGTPPFIDIANVQVANDDDYIYIHASMHSGHTSFATLYLAFDTDQNLSTGFDPFAVGVIGSEFGYQTDFPFGQATGVFNSGGATAGGPFGNGGALIYPFWTDAGAPQGTEMEWAVPRNATLAGAPVFANDSFDFAIWADSSLGDISQRISYTFAEPQDGDFDGDGDVDAADYVAWRRIDATPEGYDLWRANFGKPDAAAASSSFVPEPATGVLLACVLIGFAGVRCRHIGPRCCPG